MRRARNRSSKLKPEVVQDGHGKNVYKNNYNVEYILDHRTIKTDDGKEKTEFYVKWENYPLQESTWEPTEHLGAESTCIKEYWEKQRDPLTGLKKMCEEYYRKKCTNPNQKRSNLGDSRVVLHLNFKLEEVEKEAEELALRGGAKDEGEPGRSGIESLKYAHINASLNEPFFSVKFPAPFQSATLSHSHLLSTVPHALLKYYENVLDFRN